MVRNEKRRGKVKPMAASWVKLPEKAIKPYDSARFYTIDGKSYPSVTTILSVIDKSGPLVGWAVKEERKWFELAMLKVLTGPHASNPEEILKAVNDSIKGTKAADRAKDKAAAIGTAAHAIIEWKTRQMLGEDAGPEPEIPAEALIAFMSWEDWAKEVELKPIAIERVVVHTTYGYSGTLDLYAVVRGKLTVLDYKTGKAIYPESFLQNIAYRAAAMSAGMPSDQGLIVRLPKTLDDPAFETMIVPDTVMLESFLAAKKLWEFKRTMEGKTIGGDGK